MTMISLLIVGNSWGEWVLVDCVSVPPTHLNGPFPYVLSCRKSVLLVLSLSETVGLCVVAVLVCLGEEVG